MTIDQLRRRARKHGIAIRKDRHYNADLYYLTDANLNMAFTDIEQPMRIEQVEAWLDDLEQANDDEQPTDN